MCEDMQCLYVVCYGCVKVDEMWNEVCEKRERCEWKEREVRED